MKIYKRVVIGPDGLVKEEESYEYTGPIIALKGGDSSTTTEIPEWQQPYLKDIYGQAAGLGEKNIQYYPGQTVSPFTPEQTAAQTATTTRAMRGSPLLGAAQAENLKTTQGQYLDPSTNPWLTKTYDVAAKDVAKTFGQTTMPMIAKEAGAAGAWGGARQGVAQGAAATGFAGELSDLATKIYGPAYQQERGIQQAAVGMAPGLAEADYGDISKLAAVGQEKQAMDQAQIDAAMKQWEFSQMEPWQRLGMYSNVLTGETGGTSISTGGGK